MVLALVVICCCKGYHFLLIIHISLTNPANTLVSELESERAEHQLVLMSLEKLEPTRRCWRLVGGILVERTVCFHFFFFLFPLSYPSPPLGSLSPLYGQAY